MKPQRPDPDALLREIQRENPARRIGRLKIFVGASAGVGKTYAMLREAHEQAARGVSVVIGVVETHDRLETAAQIGGLERLPMKEIPYREILLREFDVDAAIVRSPDLVLVDELAHTNAPGSRHAKRWQDVLELLEAGIDVYTTVNIQHLESLREPIAQITGVLVNETIPDSLLARADEIEVIDVPPEELRQRLAEGKIYGPDRIDTALKGFFRTSNLMALRELALRRVADRVDDQMRALRADQGTDQVWPARDRILACIAPSPMATRVVRAAARMAATTHAEVSVLYVESHRQEARAPVQQEQLREALRLAETLGMPISVLGAHDIAGEILTHARRQNATLLVVGKPIRPRWKEILFGSVVDEIVRRSGEIDVHVVTEAESAWIQPPDSSSRPAWITPAGVMATLVTVAVGCGIGAILDRLGSSDTNIVMVLLLGIALISFRYGRGEAIFASILSVLSFNFLFVSPRYTFAVSDTQYLLTFSVMLVVALMISTLNWRLRFSAASAAERERRSAVLYTLSRALAKARTKTEILAAGQREGQTSFFGEIAFFLREGDSAVPATTSVSKFESIPSEAAVATWCLANAQPAGKDTNTLAGADALYLPLVAGQGPVGVLALRPDPQHWPLTPPQRSLLDTFTTTLGLALERAILAKETHEARIAAESERLRNSLLSSISHDLRTPLTAISGAAGLLASQDNGELAKTIYQESIRLNHQVQNLLDMTRLQSGEMHAKREWNVLEEIIGESLQRCRTVLQSHEIHTSIPGDLPLLQLDAELIVKLFVNLFENAAQHTPAGSKISISAVAQPDLVRVIVADNGPGIPRGEEAALFERFTRGGDPGKGLGLGLAICRAITRLHDARIWVRSGREGGAEFHVELPIPPHQPEVPVG